jgi:hypothetical protein
MTNNNMVAVCHHSETLPEGKLSHHDQGAILVINTDPTQSLITTKLARQYGLSVPLACTVAELAGFQMEMSDAPFILGGRE